MAAQSRPLGDLAILPGPCDWSRPACSKVPTSTGSSRWSSSRSPSAGGGPGTGSAIPGATRSSTSAPTCRRATGPTAVAAIVAWVRRLRADHGEGRGGLAVHRSSDPGHWIITFPWTGAERALTLTEAALALAERDVSPSRDRTADRRPGAAAGALDRADRRPPGRRRPNGSATPTGAIPIVSISGTNGKSTVTRLITHILLLAGRRVGTTTSDGVLVDERMVDPGDWTGPGGAHQILARRDVDVAVLETARGGIVLRGVGYESNDASVLTNVSSDHLDLQGIHTLPELAEVKSTICRITQAGRLGRAQRRRPAASPRSPGASGRSVALFTLEGDASADRRAPSRARRPGLPRARRARSSRPTARPRPPIVEVADGADHDRRAGPPQRRQRAGGGRRRARAGRDDRSRSATG